MSLAMSSCEGLMATIAPCPCPRSQFVLSGTAKLCVQNTDCERMPIVSILEILHAYVYQFRYCCHAVQENAVEHVIFCPGCTGFEIFLLIAVCCTTDNRASVYSQRFPGMGRYAHLYDFRRTDRRVTFCQPYRYHESGHRKKPPELVPETAYRAGLAVFLLPVLCIEQSSTQTTHTTRGRRRFFLAVALRRVSRGLAAAMRLSGRSIGTLGLSPATR